MPDGMTFSENLQNEKKKWKNMNGRQRWDYFKSYYMIPTIIILFIVICAVTFILQSFVLRKDVILSGFFIDEYLEAETIDSFESGLLEYIGGDKKSEEVDIGSYQMSDTSNTTQMIVTANISADALDFIIMDQNAFDRFSTYDMLGSLDNYLPADVYSEYEAAGKIANGTDSETNEEFPAGIDISGTRFAKENWPDQTVYLCFTVNSEKQEELIMLLEYLDK